MGITNFADFAFLSGYRFGKAKVKMFVGLDILTALESLFYVTFHDSGKVGREPFFSKLVF